MNYDENTREGRHLTPEERIALQAEEIKQLQQENEQLRAKLEDWKHEVQCHMDEVTARDKENEQLRAQVARMKEALEQIIYCIESGRLCSICSLNNVYMPQISVSSIERWKESLSTDTVQDYHNPADMEALRKAREALCKGIAELKVHCKYFDNTPEEDACIEMHEAVLEIDKAIGGGNVDKD